MPRTPEERTAQVERAKKQVRFDAADLQIRPRARDEVRRRSSGLFREAENAARGTRFILPRKSSTTVINVDDPENDEVPSTYEDFKKEIQRAREATRWDETTLLEDLQNKIDALAEYHGKGEIPMIHFVAMTEGSKNIADLAKQDGQFTAKAFKRFVEKYPEEMFQEFKLRDFGFTAAWDTALEVAKVNKGHLADLSAIQQWADHFGEAVAASDDFPARLTLRVERDAALKERDEKIRLLEEAAANLADAMAQQDQDQSQIRALNAALARLDSSIHENQGDRETSVVTNYTGHTDRTTGSTKRSAKVPDPAIFYNEAAKDTISFEAWHFAMTGKLAANADYWETEEAKVHYIVGRLGGKASAAIFPYVNPSNPDPVEDSGRLMTQLWNEYSNPNVQEEGIEAFNQLKMGKTEDFLTFKNEFFRLAGEARKPKSEWKAEFHRRLNNQLILQVIGKNADKNVSFDEYVRYAQEMAHGLSVLNKRRDDDRNKKKASSNSSSNQGGSGQGKPGGKSQGGRPQGISSSSTPNPNPQGSKPSLSGKARTKDEIKEMVKQGRCFSCGGKGHLSRDCPDNKKGADEAKVNAIVEKYATRFTSAPSNKNALNTSDEDNDSSNESEN